MAANTKAEFITRIAREFADNSVGKITEKVIRTFLRDLFDSVAFLTDIPTIPRGAKITGGTGEASGGADGDIYIQYTGSTLVSVSLRTGGSWNEYSVPSLQTKVNNVTANTNIPISGDGNTYRVTGIHAVGFFLPSASRLHVGWQFVAVNSSTKDLTITPDGSDTIGGIAALTVGAGEAIRIQCVANTRFEVIANKSDGGESVDLSAYATTAYVDQKDRELTAFIGDSNQQIENHERRLEVIEPDLQRIDPIVAANQRTLARAPVFADIQVLPAGVAHVQLPSHMALVLDTKLDTRTLKQIDVVMQGYTIGTVPTTQIEPFNSYGGIINLSLTDLQRDTIESNFSAGTQGVRGEIKYTFTDNAKRTDRFFFGIDNNGFQVPFFDVPVGNSPAVLPRGSRKIIGYATHSSQSSYRHPFDILLAFIPANTTAFTIEAANPSQSSTQGNQRTNQMQINVAYSAAARTLTYSPRNCTIGALLVSGFR